MAEKTVSGTKEWSSSSVNCMDGCAHDCLYCYAKATAIVRLRRKSATTWKDEVPRPPKTYGRRQGTIMFPTTHDITAGNVDRCTDVLLQLVGAGNQVLVVSKPDPDVIAKLCEPVRAFKEQILFRFTIGSADSRTLKLWEPGAPSYEKRLYSLMWCHGQGWRTSVSMEPLLQTRLDAAVQQVEALAPYVTDAIWIGKMNNAHHRIVTNCGGKLEVPTGVQVALTELLASQTDERILALYEKLKDHPSVKWKESIKKVVGIEAPTEAGLDV